MKKELIVQRDPKSPISEVFRTLRTNIQYMTASKTFKTLLITSTLPGEGKSWVSGNLAISFAQAGQRVVLIDADMRKGRQAKLFEVDVKPGLSNYLSGINDEHLDDGIENYVKNTPIDNLFVMPTGNIPPNPSELLLTDKLGTLIEQLKEYADVVIFDGPPTLLVTDAMILAGRVDSTIIVTAHKQTKKDNLIETKKAIENVGGKIGGIVFNKIPTATEKYKYGYYYGARPEEKKEIKKEREKAKKKMATKKSDKPLTKKTRNTTIKEEDEEIEFAQLDLDAQNK